MPILKLFTLARSEAILLCKTIDIATGEALAGGQTDFLSTLNLKSLRRLQKRLAGGGFGAYVGSVTDQDGDSAWELTSKLSVIRSWSNNMAVVSYERPRTYKIQITRSGFGIAHRLKLKPNILRSEFYRGMSAAAATK